MSGTVVPPLVPALDLSSVDLGVIALLSLFIGGLSGMVGMSLGVVRLPMMLAFGIDPLITAGTNLAVSVLSGVTATVPHYRAGRVVVGMVLFMGAPSAAGSYLGGHFAHLAPTWLLLGLVSVFLAASGVLMVTAGLRSRRLGAGGSEPGPSLRASAGRSKLYAGAVAGLMIGLLAGAVGAPLGVARAPTLVTVLGMEPALAVGTETVLGIITGFSGFLGHLVQGHVSWMLFGVMGGPTMVGAYAGARFVGRLHSHHLRVLFGVIVFALAPVILYQAIDRFGA